MTKTELIADFNDWIKNMHEDDVKGYFFVLKTYYGKRSLFSETGIDELDVQDMIDSAFD